MSALPKLPDDDNLSSDELSHPQFHTQHEYIPSVDETIENSDDETNNQQDKNTDGYCLLSQDFNMNQDDDDDEEEEEEERNEDEEFLRFATLRVLSSTDDTKTNQSTDSTIAPIEPVWTTKLESESFPIDDDKVDYIKNLMSSIKLPESSVPIWAQYCSEKDWQEILKEQIACRQTSFFSNDNK